MNSFGPSWLFPEEIDCGSPSTAGFPSPVTQLSSPAASAESFDSFPYGGVSSPGDNAVFPVTSTGTTMEPTYFNVSISQGGIKPRCLICKSPAVKGDAGLSMDNKRKRLVALCKQLRLQHLLHKVQTCTSEMVPLCKKCARYIREGYEAQVIINKLQTQVRECNNAILKAVIHINGDMGEDAHLLHELPEALINCRIQEENNQRRIDQIDYGFVSAGPSNSIPHSSVPTWLPVAETTTSVGFSNGDNANWQPLENMANTQPSIVVNAQPLNLANSVTVKEDVGPSTETELDLEGYEDTVVPLEKQKRRSLVNNYEIFYGAKHPENSPNPLFPARYKCPLCPYGIQIPKSRRGGRIPPLKAMKNHFARKHEGAAPIPYTKPSGFKCSACRQTIFGGDFEEFRVHQENCIQAKKLALAKKKARASVQRENTPERITASPLPQFSGAVGPVPFTYI